MTLRKLLLPALAVLLLSSAAMHRTAKGQTGSTGLSGSWIGVVTVPPGAATGQGGTFPIMAVFNSNGTATLVLGSWKLGFDGKRAVCPNHESIPIR